MEKGHDTGNIRKLEVNNILDIKKKFDVISETLNIFDLSFLVSGSTMLGLCFYAFPIMKNFFIHYNHPFLSILLCIWFSYILGLICRTLGKNIANCFYLFKDLDKATQNKKRFSSLFTKLYTPESGFASAASTKEKGDFAYSYMWMRLDTNTNADCRNRFLYVSRIWVLRAIYEGLIPSIIIFAATVLCNGDLEHLSNKVLGGYYAYIGISLIFTASIIITALLAKEAHHCDETLKREIIVAYYDFFGNKEDKREKETDDIPKNQNIH